MRRFLLPILLTLLFAPAFAQTPAPLPTFATLSGTVARDAITHRTIGNFSLGYGKDLTSTQRMFVDATFWGTAIASGGSGGAGWEVLAWNSKKGTHLVLGADGEVPVGGIDANLLAIGKVKLEREVRDVRWSLAALSVTPINPGPTGDSVKQIAATLGIAFLNR